MSDYIITATETGAPPPNRREVGDRIIIAKVRVKVEGEPVECWMFAEEYNSDDVLGCEHCAGPDGEGPGCDKCDDTGHEDANSFAVALGTTEENAREAYTLGDDDHYVAPCWCGNKMSLHDRAAWLAEQAEDAGLSPFAGEEDE